MQMQMGSSKCKCTNANVQMGSNLKNTLYKTSMTVAGQPAVNYTYDANSRLTKISRDINGTGIRNKIKGSSL
ncbi:MAG: hypothetical protein HZA00_01845 [Nitrospinae bacterium]|nr:hypothetical protein [Nitrospinota bacterium]